MEEMKKTAVRRPRGRQRPVKTEWNSRCVLLTYFQGDISSVVDEHFSRALGNIKRPHGLSPLSQHEDVILRNDSDMAPNQWHFSSPWTKPGASLANGDANCSFMSDPMNVDQYPMSLNGSPSAHPGELWHFSSLASPSSPEPGYSHAYPAGHLVPETQLDGKCEPLLSLLQQDRCLAHPQESARREEYNPVQIAGSSGSFLNLSPSSTHCKKMYVSPSWGPASTSLAHETPNHWSHQHGYPQHL
ncbi:transcription cofactor vestigial-like protein 1 [Tupaia chinensis]|uniref:transcription cofactor vestigial-like protein 1 n=1 Tax=Tupaia chinensis TaxID=246437 RepID=UPI0003C8EBAD|nr:transcription cofactor vestigial-like protein 1 [Tupaia chinensis]